MTAVNFEVNRDVSKEKHMCNVFTKWHSHAQERRRQHLDTWSRITILYGMMADCAESTNNHEIDGNGRSTFLSKERGYKMARIENGCNDANHRWLTHYHCLAVTMSYVDTTFICPLLAVSIVWGHQLRSQKISSSDMSNLTQHHCRGPCYWKRYLGFGNGWVVAWYLAKPPWGFYQIRRIAVWS